MRNYSPRETLMDTIKDFILSMYYMLTLVIYLTFCSVYILILFLLATAPIWLMGIVLVYFVLAFFF